MKNVIQEVTELYAPVERVWKALTDSWEFGTWFRAVFDEPFVPGQVIYGRVTYPGYEHVKLELHIVRMEKPGLFSYSWHPYAVDPAIDYSAEAMTLVEFLLEPTANGTRLTVTESGFNALPEARRDEALKMNGEGWAEQLENIRVFVERS